MPMNTPKPSQTVAPVTLATVNALDETAFGTLLGGVVEHSPWVAQTAWIERPFPSLDALFDALRRSIQQARPARQLALLRVHPELAGSEAVAGTMTTESNEEQGRLGLLSLAPEDFARLTDLNRRYRERFGFPYVAAMRLHRSLADVFHGLEQRLTNDLDTEFPLAIAQVCEVMRGRLARTVLADAQPPVTPPFSTINPPRSAP
jgi:2-oxo-4-hydroxy-4-carboxy-5-ureidoimidazoline decarboxylase